MQVRIHVSSFYDWRPVPPKTKVTAADKKAQFVKPAADGGWLMRVPKNTPSHTDVLLPEHELLAHIVGEAVHKRFLSRKEALGQYLSQRVLPHHAHQDWITGIEVHDDGPVPTLFKAVFAPQIAAGLISQEDSEELLGRYSEQLDSKKYVEYLHQHFGVKE